MKKKISIKIPATWNELSDSQLRRVAALFHSGQSSVAFDVRLWFIIRNVRWWQLRKLYNCIVVWHNVPISELKKHYSFIYTTNGRTVFPVSVKNNKAAVHYPPLPNISNLSVEEFALADDMHIKFRDSGNLEFLQMLTAILYVPSELRRPEFVKEVLPHLSDSFAKVKPAQLLAIELAYFGCKTAITKKFPKAFPKTGAGNKSGKSKYGFAKVILEMAGGKFGNHADTRKTNIYTFLEQFQQDIINAKENKKS